MTGFPVHCNTIVMIGLRAWVGGNFQEFQGGWINGRTLCVEIISAVTRQIRFIENEVDWKWKKKKRCPHEHEVATYTVMTVSRMVEDPMLSNSSCAVAPIDTNQNRNVDAHHGRLLNRYDECRGHVQTVLRPQGACSETVSGPQTVKMAGNISIDSWSSSKNGS